MFKILLLLLLFLCGTLYGVLMHRNHLPPYGFLKTVLSHSIDKDTSLLLGRDETVYLEHLEKNIAGLISIKQHQDIFKLRDELISFLWGGASSITSL